MKCSVRPFDGLQTGLFIAIGTDRGETGMVIASFAPAERFATEFGQDVLDVRAHEVDEQSAPDLCT